MTKFFQKKSPFWANFVNFAHCLTKQKFPQNSVPTNFFTSTYFCAESQNNNKIIKIIITMNIL